MKLLSGLLLPLLAVRALADEPAAPATPNLAVTAPAAAAPAPITAPPAEAAPAATNAVAAVTAMPALGDEAGLSLAPVTAGELQFNERLRRTEVETDLATPLPATNTIELRGLAPRVARPSKFGSVLQLFNPFAPVDPAAEPPPVNFYDGELRVTPRPRAFRDDKTETPVGGQLISVGK